MSESKNELFLAAVPAFVEIEDIFKVAGVGILEYFVFLGDDTLEFAKVSMRVGSR